MPTQDLTAGHIHLAPAGKNGSVVVGLFRNSAPSGLENGVIARGVITEDDLIGQLRGHPLDKLFTILADESAYVNIHTNSYPAGEIRGQVSLIMPSENGNYNTQLSGKQEVPSNNSNARGVANFKFNADNSALTYKINLANLDNVTAAHIHFGKADSNGPVVVTLGYGKDGPLNGVYAQGVITSDDLSGLLGGGDLEMLREAFRTGNAYVNVHSVKFPRGELRGQL